jgi:hypothetical protein
VNDADRAVVTELIGRPLRGECEVAVRNAAGAPVVIRNAPNLADGTPMPTLYWLVGRAEHDAVSRLEAAGGVRQAGQEVAPDAIAEAHERYRLEREDAARRARVDGGSGRVPAHQPTGGVGGTRRGVKCLHAHLAWYLAGGDDPVGEWTADRLGLDRDSYVVEPAAAGVEP